MDRTELYQAYYNEHSAQAKLHEEQRERITGIVLTIATLLIGLVTFAKLALVALAASIPIILLGVYGWFFAGKHYERFKFHTAVMRRIRQELDVMYAAREHVGASLETLRSEAEASHYRRFRWPAYRKSLRPAQGGAASWIARRRLHVFWEGIHLMVALIGVGLTIGIVVKKFVVEEPEITRVQIVGPTACELARSAALRCAPSTQPGPAGKH
ncbi:hypothetical protein [Pseudoduganella chitinolytica]|uniref:DUF4231 domain-containing protein n=1 Tax=Pseudoduganella chitinolytica TaxID=34070 RepID=A0ABY8BLH6_9BURK|nr:hypothetical protein [Pseudoduganella chitinolytica]WEF35527.1 hypothetical protein PX653_12495 [Pseudoduganella chitinolytica]